MEKPSVKEECEEEIKSISRNRTFWEQHISWLTQQGGEPSQDDIAWVKSHLKGLDETLQRLEGYIAKMEQAKNA